MRSFSVIFAKYNEDDKVREDEMGRACSTYGEKRNSYRVLVESQKRRDH
jgi:hypothetical protein